MPEQNWPAFEYEEWKSTYETLHRWLQIVGKIKLSRSPWLNHSWHSTFTLTGRGFTTGAIPLHREILNIDFDFIEHKLILQSSSGKTEFLNLQSMATKNFYQAVMDKLRKMNITIDLSPRPNECSDNIAFYEDTIHHTYRPSQVEKMFRVFVNVHNVFLEFRSRYIGKCSPVHLFWGGFDLAVTRFSGAMAPEYNGEIPFIPKEVMKEAYSHEVSSCGFWPGNEMYQKPAFYSYCYPGNERYGKTKVEPDDAYFHKDLGEFLLDYEVVRASENPEKLILEFLESTFSAARLSSGHWQETPDEYVKLNAMKENHPYAP